MSTLDLRDRLLTILAADVAGYSRLMSMDDRATVAALDVGRTVCREHIAAHGGRIVDMAGDSVLSVFETAVEATNAAVAIQRRLSLIAADFPEDRRMRYRIGIHVGDVIIKPDGSVYGDGVNIAARIEGLAAPGGVAVSLAIHSLVAAQVDAVFDDIGEQRLKNVAQPVRVFRLRRARSESDADRGDDAIEATVPPSNLPIALPRLFGRDDDITAIRTLVCNHRVVSIVGAGGIGKTRLAQAAAHKMRLGFADGVWMIELAPISNPALLPVAVAQALSVSLSGNRSAKEEMIGALHGRALLLVLDNCEHLVGAASAFVTAVVEQAPHVRLLVTSQESLKIPQEHLYHIGTLGLPMTHEMTSVGGSAAVELLLSRVQALQPTFAIREHNIADVVEICERLDGLPLALEFAAGRIPMLGVAGVRQHLSERFRILTTGARTALPRHQTLHHTLDWSHSLLDSDEAVVFRRCGAFMGGFNMTAAQNALSDDRLDKWAVFERLGALVDKSLVLIETSDPPRYRLLESTRAYALERLRESGETEWTSRRHAEAMVAVFEDSFNDEFVVTAQARLKRYAPDLDNLRAALDWASGRDGDADLQITLAGASAWIWVGAGLRADGMRRVQLAIARINPATAPFFEARLLGCWSNIAHPQNGPQELAADARAVQLYRSLGDARTLFAALCQQLRTLAVGKRLKGAELIHQEAIGIFDASWPPALRARLSFASAWLYRQQGRSKEAANSAEEMRRLAMEVDEKRLALGALVFLDVLASDQGNWEESVRLGREMVRLMGSDRFLRSGIENLVFSNLSSALTELGDIDAAVEAARIALSCVERAGRLQDIIDPFALLAFKRGRVDDAARMLGRSDVLYATGNYSRERSEQEMHDRLMQLLSSALPPEKLTALLKEGESLSDGYCARLALQD